MAKDERKRGAALISVLWITLFVSLLLAGALGALRIETQISAARLEMFLAERALYAAAMEAAFDLSVSEQSIDAIAYAPRTLTVDGRQVRVAVEPENGKADINAADPEIIETLAAASEPDTAAALTSFVAARTNNGADARISSMHELPAVLRLNVNAECLARRFTIYTRASEPNWANAPRDMIEAAGIEPPARTSSLAGATRSARAGQSFTINAETTTRRGARRVVRLVILVTQNPAQPFSVYESALIAGDRCS